MPRGPSVGTVRQPPRPEDFHSPLHGPRLTARLGVWLGAAFLLCFVTGVVSHLQQDPVLGLVLPTGPAWGYRLTQGLHVVTGTASLPLLLAKIYSAYPRLFERPLVGGPLRLLERLATGALVASAFFLLLSGLVNVAQWYAVLGFGFRQAHFALAWVAVGSIAVHVAVKLPVIRDALTAPLDLERPRPVDPAGTPR